MLLSIAEAVNTDSRQEDARGHRVDFFLSLLQIVLAEALSVVRSEHPCVNLHKNEHYEEG